MGTLQTLTSTEAFRIGSAIRNALLDADVQANICVVNRDQTVLFTLGMDDTRPFTRKVAYLKACQSALTGRRTSYLRDQVARNEITPEVLGINLPEFIKWAGGVPIYTPDGGTLLGGAGVSALSETSDESFCIAGVEYCGFSSDRDLAVETNIEGVCFVHHTGIRLPRAIADALVTRLVSFGAKVVKEDDKGNRWLRLNPWDESLLEISIAEMNDIYVHMDCAVENLNPVVETLGARLVDLGVPNMLFEMLGKEELPLGVVEAAIAFAQRPTN